MSFRRTAMMIGALLPLCAVTVAGQQGHHAGRGMQMMGQQPGMMAWINVFAPTSLLELQDSLGLTVEQLAVLTELQQKTATTREPALAGHDRNREQLMRALNAAEPDLRTVRGHFDAAHASMGAAHWAELEAALTARRLLTGEQRDFVERRLPPGWRGQGGCCGN